MASPADSLRRWFGLFFLAIAAGMLVWGQVVLRDYLMGVVFLAYWGCCFLCVILAVVIALLDLRAVRRRVREDQLRLMQRALQDLDESKPGQTAGPPNREGSRQDG